MHARAGRQVRLHDGVDEVGDGEDVGEAGGEMPGGHLDGFAGDAPELVAVTTAVALRSDAVDAHGPAGADTLAWVVEECSGGAGEQVVVQGAGDGEAVLGGGTDGARGERLRPEMQMDDGSLRIECAEELVGDVAAFGIPETLDDGAKTVGVVQDLELLGAEDVEIGNVEELGTDGGDGGEEMHVEAATGETESAGEGDLIRASGDASVVIDDNDVLQHTRSHSARNALLVFYKPGCSINLFDKPALLMHKDDPGVLQTPAANGVASEILAGKRYIF